MVPRPSRVPIRQSRRPSLLDHLEAAEVARETWSGGMRQRRRRISPRLQPLDDVSGSWKPLARVLLHHVSDQVDKLVTNFRVEFSRVPGGLLAMPTGLVACRATGKRDLSGDGIVKRTSKRIDVAYGQRRPGAWLSFPAPGSPRADDLASPRIVRPPLRNPARPKSETFTEPSGVTSKLPGLTSR